MSIYIINNRDAAQTSSTGRTLTGNTAGCEDNGEAELTMGVRRRVTWSEDLSLAA
jgi:hypothetical protein